MKNLFLLSLTFLLLIPMMACDDDPSGNNGNNTNLTNEQFLAELADRYPETYCDFIARCPQPEGEEWMVDRESCVTVMDIMLRLDFLREMEWALENGATFSSANLDACMETIEDLACTESDDQIEACEQVLVGTLEVGAECASDFQCASGHCDRHTSCPGACAERIALGGACADGGECAHGLMCDWENDECVTRPDPMVQGGACEWHDDCAYGLFCQITDLENYEGARQPWLGLGDECATDGPIENICEPGLACDSESGLCAEVTLADISQPCDGETVQCDLSEHAICHDQGDGSRLCIELPGTGEACLEDDCWPGNYCGTDGLCHRSKEVGEACTEDDECLTYWCDGTVCAYTPCEEG